MTDSDNKANRTSGGDDDSDNAETKNDNTTYPTGDSTNYNLENACTSNDSHNAPIHPHEDLIIYQPKTGKPKCLRASNIIAQTGDDKVWTKVQPAIHYKEATQ